MSEGTEETTVSEPLVALMCEKCAFPLERLQAEIFALRQQLANAKAEVERLREQLAEAEAWKRDARERNRDLHSERAILQDLLADCQRELAAAQAREQELRHELHSRWLDTEYDQDDNDLFVAYWCRKCNGSGAEWDSIDHDPDCELADKPDHTALNAALAAARRAGAADWRGRCVEHLNSQAKASASSTAILYYAIAREVSCLPLEETT